MCPAVLIALRLSALSTAFYCLLPLGALSTAIAPTLNCFPLYPAGLGVYSLLLLSLAKLTIHCAG